MYRDIEWSSAWSIALAFNRPSDARAVINIVWLQYAQGRSASIIAVLAKVVKSTNWSQNSDLTMAADARHALSGAYGGR